MHLSILHTPVYPAELSPATFGTHPQPNPNALDLGHRTIVNLLVQSLHMLLCKASSKSPPAYWWIFWFSFRTCSRAKQAASLHRLTAGSSLSCGVIASDLRHAPTANPDAHLHGQSDHCSYTERMQLSIHHRNFYFFSQ